MTRPDFARATVGALIISAALTALAVADEVKRVSANSIELAYVEVGQGEPVIFIHGGLQDYRMWLEHLPKFAGRYRAIAYSRRNNYPNDVSPDGMPDGAADADGEDLAAFVRALGYQKSASLRIRQARMLRCFLLLCIRKWSSASHSMNRPPPAFWSAFPVQLTC